jgi:hypothetical protein
VKKWATFSTCHTQRKLHLKNSLIALHDFMEKFDPKKNLRKFSVIFFFNFAIGVSQPNLGIPLKNLGGLGPLV